MQHSRECESGQQAITCAAAEIRGWFADVVIAGGTEHMTRVPIRSNSPAADNEINRNAVSDTYFEYFEYFDGIPTQGGRCGTDR
jgi:acetyl-CoA C-acetyltransferase/acetyl-CoA acyltransferase